MTVARGRRPAARHAARMASPAAANVISMFAECNPQFGHGDLAEVGELVAAFGAIAVTLSSAARKRLLARKARFQALLAQMADAPDAAPPPLKLVATAPPETAQGAGLGGVLPAEEGRARIAAYATPRAVADWAGPLAGPTGLKRGFGVARSTLHAWQKQGAVIGLLIGVRKHAFPLEQFVDGRPVAGLGAVIEAIGDGRTAWLWLRQPNPGFAGATPLTRLKAGAIDRVVEMARANFGHA